MTGDLVPFRRLPEKRKEAVEVRRVAVESQSAPRVRSNTALMLGLALLPTMAGLLVITAIVPWVGLLIAGLMLGGVLLVAAVAAVRQ